MERGGAGVASVPVVLCVALHTPASRRPASARSSRSALPRERKYRIFTSLAAERLQTRRSFGSNDLEILTRVGNWVLSPGRRCSRGLVAYFHNTTWKNRCAVTFRRIAKNCKVDIPRIGAQRLISIRLRHTAHGTVLSHAVGDARKLVETSECKK